MQVLQLVGPALFQQVGTGGQDLAEFNEGWPQSFQGRAQTFWQCLIINLHAAAAQAAKHLA